MRACVSFRVFRCAAALVAVAASVLVQAPAGAAMPDRPDPLRTAWVWPLDGAVVRAFDPPATPFGRGHLGIDLAARPGTPVRAAGAGVVVFAGAVAGSLHVVVAHPGDLRTSYSFVASIAVRRGERVRTGDVVGTTGGLGGDHAGAVLHFGLRVGATYVDPMQLLRPDLAAVVHLAPTRDAPLPASVHDERGGLVAGLARDLRGAGRLAAGAYDAARSALASAAVWTRDHVADAGGAATRALASALPFQSAAMRAFVEWIGQHGHCDAHAPAADGSGGSDHRVVLVAGIDSSLTGGATSMHLPVAALGYAQSDVTSFSYARDGGDYTAADTEGPLLVAARRLGAQLRDLERKEPGREVDLLAHSQGGVVTEVFLTLVYDPTDPSYPPLGTVVTLSSPLAGAPIASAIADVRSTRSGRAALGLLATGSAGALAFPSPSSPAVRDLASGSPLMRRLDAAHLPEQVDLTAVGAATDLMVPGNASWRRGANHTVIVPKTLDAHNGILGDPEALRAVRAALERRPLPCRSLATILAGEVVPETIARLERGAGHVGEVAGGVVDAAS